MTTREFLQKLRMQGVQVWADGDRLRVNAPQNALTAELQAALTARKLEIQSFLEAIAAKRSSLVPIQPSGSRPVFFGVPGPDGDVFCYLQLSRQLGPDQPFYAFEAPGVDGTQPPLTGIEALAGLYLRDLKVFQPDGPYYIGGFCLGGIVAFELARQLRAQGQDVALLALLESPSPNGLKPRHRAAGARWCRRDAIVARLRWLGAQPWPERLAFVQNRLTRVLRGCDPAAPGQPVRGWQEEQKDRVFRATLEAAYAYVLEARTYPGRIVLFLGSQGLRRSAYWRQLDWARVAAGGLEVNVGPAGCTDHLMMLRDPPRVLALAELLKPYLARPPRRPR